MQCLFILQVVLLQFQPADLMHQALEAFSKEPILFMKEEIIIVLILITGSIFQPLIKRKAKYLNYHLNGNGCLEYIMPTVVIILTSFISLWMQKLINPKLNKYLSYLLFLPSHITLNSEMMKLKHFASAILISTTMYSCQKEIVIESSPDHNNLVYIEGTLYPEKNLLSISVRVEHFLVQM